MLNIVLVVCTISFHIKAKVNFCKKKQFDPLPMVLFRSQGNSGC